MMAKSVYDEYALCLFDFGLSYNDIICDLKVVSSLLDDKQIFSFFSSPNIKKEEKKNLLKEIFKLENQKILYFLYVLLDNERLFDLKNIILSFENLLFERKNVMVFSLETAFEIEDDKQENIKNVLKNKYQKEIILNVKYDKSLIGGFILKHKDKIYDASLLNNLEVLKTTLKETRN